MGDTDRCAVRDGGRDVQPGSRGLPPLPELSRGKRVAGAVSLVACFVVLQWLVAAWSGYSPATFAGLWIGSFIGLVSLAVELSLVGRASRDPHSDGLQVVLGTFMMRCMTVGALTLGFWAVEAIDAQAFAVSYCSTFVVYLVWLTWRMAMTPSSYAMIQQQKKVAAAIAQRELEEASQR